MIDLHLPRSARALLLDSPHSGIEYPPDYDHAVDRQRLRDAEDTHVDALFLPWVAQGATFLTARFPRSYVDVNRAATDIDETLLDARWPAPIAPTRKSEMGKGLVWRCLDDGTPIYRRRLRVAEVQDRIERCWQPYWNALMDHSARLHDEHGRLFHINCHSMPSTAGPLAHDTPGSAELPDFVVGDRDGTSSGAAFSRFVGEWLIEQGYRVSWNAPYKGVEIVRVLGQPARGAHSIQLEINRALYMDERSREPIASFGPLQNTLSALCSALIERFEL
ncbi:MAG TPA: N-formylglutamate amidohydrolase [Burkholderiaceae bacterium]|nr:N-formylglutamate amidohydrolase [Burkholderiaceae bacterium]